MDETACPSSAKKYSYDGVSPGDFNLGLQQILGYVLVCWYSLQSDHCYNFIFVSFICGYYIYIYIYIYRLTLGSLEEDRYVLFL